MSRVARSGRLLPVILLTCASVVLLLGVADLAWGIVFGLAVHRADIAVSAAVTAARQPGVYRFWAAFTEDRDLAGSIVVVLTCTAGLWLLKRRAAATFLFGVVVSGTLVSTLFKDLVVRTRVPDMLTGVTQFPSGTAVIGLTLSVAIAIILMREFGVARGIAPGAVLIGFGVALGLSRLYIGVHWWSEVLGGWMFALAWLAAWSAGWIRLDLRRR